MSSAPLLKDRSKQIHRKGSAPFAIDCNKESLAGAVSQRACVFCGSRVVLYPIADALHLVHGPIGCAVYTWDIRGALSSGPELHRLSFSTDLQELDVVFGGEKKLAKALDELIDLHKPKAAFVYSTCIVGIIGDDLEAVCKKTSAEKGIPVLPVESSGFKKGNKRGGYEAACQAMSRLVGMGDISNISKHSINILGDFNLAGEIWLIREYFERIGIEVVANITGDGRVADIQRCHGAALNVVQCSGATMDLANMLKDGYGIPSIRVSYFGIEDMAEALYAVARHFENPEMLDKARQLVKEELATLLPELTKYKKALTGKKAAIYVGGAFKAFSLVKAFRLIGMDVVMVGSQTGTKEDYIELDEITDEGCIIVDDSNPLELSSFLKEKDVDLFVGGVKERPIAYKLGVAFCDHNHERKEMLAGFQGMMNFAREVYGSVMSPVWKFVPRRTKEDQS
jgi:nitrogenase molybdenum-cofactor synthesis protein NifE